jgi:hypothetical protein
MEVPRDSETLMESPPSISENHTKTHKFEKPTVILESEDFVAMITLSEKVDDKVRYRFKAYSKIHKLEVSGGGELFERYYSVSAPNSEEEQNKSRVFDKGSKLIIDAGIFKVTWSAGSYIYLQNGVSAEVGDEIDYRIRITR